MSGIEIRTLIFDDWERVRSIYLEGIATGQATFETRAPSWADWDSAHLPAPRLVSHFEQVDTPSRKVKKEGFVTILRNQRDYDPLATGWKKISGVVYPTFW